MRHDTALMLRLREMDREGWAWCAGVASVAAGGPCFSVSASDNDNMSTACTRSCDSDAGAFISRWMDGWVTRSDATIGKLKHTPQCKLYAPSPGVLPGLGSPLLLFFSWL